jgi:hypothetical protein
MSEDDFDGAPEEEQEVTIKPIPRLNLNVLPVMTLYNFITGGGGETQGQKTQACG